MQAGFPSRPHGTRRRPAHGTGERGPRSVCFVTFRALRRAPNDRGAGSGHPSLGMRYSFPSSLRRRGSRIAREDRRNRAPGCRRRYSHCSWPRIPAFAGMTERGLLREGKRHRSSGASAHPGPVPGSTVPRVRHRDLPASRWIPPQGRGDGMHEAVSATSLQMSTRPGSRPNRQTPSPPRRRGSRVVREDRRNRAPGCRRRQSEPHSHCSRPWISAFVGMTETVSGACARCAARPVARRHTDADAGGTGVTATDQIRPDLNPQPCIPAPRKRGPALLPGPVSPDCCRGSGRIVGMVSAASSARAGKGMRALGRSSRLAVVHSPRRGVAVTSLGGPLRLSGRGPEIGSLAGCFSPLDPSRSFRIACAARPAGQSPGGPFLRSRSRALAHPFPRTRVPAPFRFALPRRAMLAHRLPLPAEPCSGVPRNLGSAWAALRLRNFRGLASPNRNRMRFPEGTCTVSGPCKPLILLWFPAAGPFRLQS